MTGSVSADNDTSQPPDSNVEAAMPPQPDKPRRRSVCGWIKTITWFVLVTLPLLLLTLLLYIPLFIYLFCCPPVPEYIRRKFAFSPFRHFKRYTVTLTSDPSKKIRNAKQLVGNQFELHMKCAPHKWHSDRVQTGTVTTKHGSVLVWAKTSPTSEDTTNKIIIFANGNAGDLGVLNPDNKINIFRQTKFYNSDIIAFDYSGYGYSTGTASEANIYADIEAVYEMIRATWPHKKIILMGISLGTAAAVDLASKNPEGVEGVILLAPLASGLLTVDCCHWLKPHLSRFDAFRSMHKAPHVHIPTLIIHGTHDAAIHWSHGQLLHGSLARPVEPLFLEGGQHHDLLSSKWRAPVNSPDRHTVLFRRSGNEVQQLVVFSRIKRFLYTETAPARRYPWNVPSFTKQPQSSMSFHLSDIETLSTISQD